MAEVIANVLSDLRSPGANIGFNRVEHMIQQTNVHRRVFEFRDREGRQLIGSVE